MEFKIRQPQQFSVDMAWPAFDPSQLSDVPETWSKATVTERTMDDGVAKREDGSEHPFRSHQLFRDMTYFENTQVGCTIWIREPDGGISAHAPDPRSARQRYDDMMREQVKTFSDTVDAQAAKAVEEIYK